MGYYQIMIYLDEEEKTAFITYNGIYCYKVMPFGLKNIGATYLRMVNCLFKDLLGSTMEAYVDDMIVKSKQRVSHVDQLVKVFERLRKYSMKLNPNNCTFGVKSGKFLRYMITN